MIEQLARAGRWLALCAALACAARGSKAAESSPLHDVWAITGARIVTMAGAPIDAGVVVVRHGLVEAVGTSVTAPADAEIVDGTGLTVYPGLIDALNESILKLPERTPPKHSPAGQYTDEERGLTPQLHAWEFANLGKATLAKQHAAGIVAVQAMPTVGLLPGQAAVLVLSGEKKEDALLVKDSALGVTFTPGPGYPDSLMGVMAFLRQEMTDAAAYATHAARWAAEPAGIVRPAHDPRHEILSHAAAAALPVIFACRNQHDIRRALSLIEELKLRGVIADLGGEAFRALPELARAGVPVLASVTFRAPSSALWSQQSEEDRQRAEKEIYPANAKALAGAGVAFAFASLGTDTPEAFMAGVRAAVEAGLPSERALAAMTADAAAVTGTSRVLGTIEPGKIANLVVTEGEMFAKDCKVKVVFADGKRFVVKERKLKDGNAPTVNVTGRWELAVERGMGAGTKSILTLTQDESSLSGTYAGTRGDVDFTDGEVAGKEIAFEVSMSFGGRSFDLFVSGTVEGDTIRGSITTARGSNPFTAKRIP